MRLKYARETPGNPAGDWLSNFRVLGHCIAPINAVDDAAQLKEGDVFISSVRNCPAEILLQSPTFR